MVSGETKVSRDPLVLLDLLELEDQKQRLAVKDLVDLRET